MPLIRHPVAFPAINFLPGFPGLSRFDCNPWARPGTPGACGNAPVDISRQPGQLPATAVVRRALIAAGVGPAAVQHSLARGIVPAASLAGCGCGCGGTCGCGGDEHWGLGDLTADIQGALADPLGWLKLNLLPLAVGAGIVLILKRGR